jgi:SpoVK/Ycf46/Vps4 family AAA+-type ATPase
MLTKAMLENTSETILVICFTNHALDQFLEDLLDIGIPQELMVRLGQKSTARTKALQLREQSSTSVPPWSVINAKREETDAAQLSLDTLVTALQSFKLDWQSIMDFLVFSQEDSDFYDALQVPDYDPREQIVGYRGKPITGRYLYDRWRGDHDAGVFKRVVSRDHAYIWAMDRSTREAKVSAWRGQLLQEHISGIVSLVDSYNQSESMLREAWDQKDSGIIRSKRIIACTTTAAAKYTKHLCAAEPGIIVVEEAGEILESHVLTAMTPKTKQLILIGDHQQLRPKVNNYALTVEKGDGFDLNRSLFERLILSGFPHTTLRQQHRMCPEISSLVRSLTYEHLVDAQSTLKRNAIKGICGRVIFIDHRCPEVAASQIHDRRDPGATVSRQNIWEASMVLKIVKYMAQQGYGTSNQAVLTPYLGQLSLLRHELAKENDPVLNDLDSFELIKAGIMSSSNAGPSKGRICLSTIDNFQGQESDVVVASLTRSNGNGDIGFMVQPERLNVLLSRARKALIIIGNSDTFLSSRRGVDTWKPFFDLMKQSNSIYDGLPVKCERHPDRQNVLKQPSDFDDLCPDGGCSEPCGTKLRCGVHDCPRRCHALADHSKMDCMIMVSDQCPKNHKLSWRCFRLRPASCMKCDAEAKALAKRQEADAKLDYDRQQKQAAYARRLAEIQDKIDRTRREIQEQNEDEEMEDTLRQRQKDLENAITHAHSSKKQKLAKQSTAVPQMPGSFEGSTDGYEGSATAPAAAENDTHDTPKISSDARDDWEHQKRLEGETNEHLDELMAMIGLENVKEAFLEIKAKVDLTVRQGTSLAKERFGASLLGNPGTGKTTVARLYAKFLSSVGALPGDEFVETTGAKLANEGVQGCKKILDSIKKAGGGALFIDEAYQLTSGSSFGGAAVLDFLLAEVENLTGKVVFILAGYNKNMESFFAHNPGLPSRFPREIQFTDYEDDELLEIFNYELKKKYGQRMAVEDGSYGLYARIVARRLGRGRGKVGFGNARAVENALSVIASRQAKRVRRERRDGKTPEDMLLKREDLIGAKPSDVLKSNRSWKKLQQLTGLTSVKESISALFDSITYNYQREIDEKPIVDFSLNKVFIGSPGTGKTTVANLYGQILADIGLLSTNEGEWFNLSPNVPADCVQSS